jgi:hypothetical protein
MYETAAPSTAKCLAYSIADHLNCVTLDSWPGQTRLAALLGCRSTKTVQRAAQSLARLGVLTLCRMDDGRYRYAPVFIAGDEDRNVGESLLPIRLTSSDPTEAAGRGSEKEQMKGYGRRQRGAVEIKVAEMLGQGGMEMLARFAAIDDLIVERLCRAYASGLLGDREIAAARLAADQIRALR